MDQLTALRAFVRLVELEAFSAVGEELRVKQSTVSKWIASLEEDLGVRLVDRTTRSLRVTDVGQRFYRRASAIVADYEDAVGEARETAGSLRGGVRMSVPVVFGQRYVVPALTAFLIDNPELAVDLHFSDRYVRLVEEGYDLAVRVGIPVDSTLRSHALGEGQRRLVAAPAYLEARGMPEAPRDLEQHQCLVHTEPSSRAAWAFRKGDETHEVSVGGRVSVSHSESTLYMAKAGLGIALLARWLADSAVERGELTVLLQDYTPRPAPVHALTPPGRLLPPRVRALIEHLRASIQPALGDG